MHLGHGKTIPPQSYMQKTKTKKNHVNNRGEMRDTEKNRERSKKSNSHAMQTGEQKVGRDETTAGEPD
jgi:hypothetical protein